MFSLIFVDFLLKFIGTVVLVEYHFCEYEIKSIY